MNQDKQQEKQNDDYCDSTVVDTEANSLKPVDCQYTPAAYEDFVNYPALLDAEDERYRIRNEQLATEVTQKIVSPWRSFWQWFKWFVNRNDPPRREE